MQYSSHLRLLLASCYCCSDVKFCPTLHHPMDCSMPGFSVPHHLPEFAQVHVPLNRWCHLTISSSVTIFSFCLQSFPATGSFPMSHLLTSGGQSVAASATSSILSMSIQCWFPFRLTGLISLLSKGLSRVFSSTTVRKHQIFGALPSLWSSSHIHT